MFWNKRWSHMRLNLFVRRFICKTLYNLVSHDSVVLWVALYDCTTVGMCYKRRNHFQCHIATCFIFKNLEAHFYVEITEDLGSDQKMESSDYKKFSRLISMRSVSTPRVLLVVYVVASLLGTFIVASCHLLLVKRFSYLYQYIFSYRL